MANLRAVLQDQEARRLVDEDPDQHSHPLFRQSPGRKMQGAQGREGIKRNRIRNERFPGSGDRTQKTNRRTDPREGDGRKETDGRRRTEGDRRGSLAQGPGTKTEAGNGPGEQDRASPDLHRHHKPGRRKRGPKEPQSRSRSHARASASVTPLPNTRMTASTSQRRHGATARARPTHGTRHQR